VATILLTIGVTLAGLLAFQLLPVAPLPQVDIPTISVSASLPGAGRDGRDERRRSAGAPPWANRQCDGDDVDEQHGQARIVLQFDLDRDINGAARDVQAAINDANADLPTNLRAIRPIARSIRPTRRF